MSQIGRTNSSFDVYNIATSSSDYDAIENMTSVPIINVTIFTDIDQTNGIEGNLTLDNMSMINITNLTNSYTITSLKPATEYVIRIGVSNDQGMSMWSDILKVKTNYTGKI